MSGPKVVRIVTREEIEAICRRHLANVREAANELRRCAKRYDVLDDRLQADIERRSAALERLLAEGRFRELQKQAPLVVGFFTNEVDGIRARAVAAAEAARSKRRRIAAAAVTLISALESSGRPPPADLRDIAARADFASDVDLAAMQSVLNRNYSSLRQCQSGVLFPRRASNSRSAWGTRKLLGLSPTGWQRRVSSRKSAMRAWIR
jgi:hypothetical protein